MAGAADDEGLAAACCHPPGPCGLSPLSLGDEVFEGTDVVHLDLPSGFAHVAAAGQEPLDEF
jgi:hypothetical protein